MNAPHFIVLPVKARRFGIFPYWRNQAFFFNMSAWMSFYDEYGWDLELIPKIPPAELTSKMIFHAAKQGNYEQGKPFRMSYLELTTQVANMRREDGEKLDEVFKSSATVVSEKMQGIAKSASKKK